MDSEGPVEKTKCLLFQGPLFSVPKRNTTKRRVILDLSALNKSIACPTFWMTTVEDVRQVLPIGAFSTSIDLKDAYWYIPVHPCSGNTWGFCLGQQNFQFMTLPFGLNLAPRVFTKLCRPILRELRSRGVKVLVYLDDWLMWGNSPEECAQFTDMVLVTLANAVS